VTGSDDWWDRYADRFRELTDCIVYPDRATAPAAVERYAMLCLWHALPLIMHSDPEHPEFLPVYNSFTPIGATNPDTAYNFSTIGAGGTYRISGYRGTVFIADLQFGRDMGGFAEKSGPGLDNFDFDDFTIREDGWIEIVVGQARPEGYMGDFRKIDPTANYVLIRQMSIDWYREQDARVAIERIDIDRPSRSDSPEKVRSRLNHVRDYTGRMLSIFSSRARVMEDRGANVLHSGPYAATGGVPMQQYFEGVYEFGEGEALIFSAPMPDKVRYWSAHLSDATFLSLDFIHRQTSLNPGNSQLDDDGVLRVVVCESDPGVQNWLDASGHRRGIIMWRWLQCSDYPMPTVERVPVNQVRHQLAPGTAAFSPSQRAEALHRRRIGGQWRRRW
jgi:hypothetical protein